MTESEAILLERFSTRADAEAFAELVQRYVRLVYSTSWRVLKDEGDAADVTQETFFELTRQADRISGPLGSWLHQVATRKSIDLIRRSAHRRQREQAYAQARAEEVRTWHDLSGHVDEALDELDQSVKSVLLEHFLAGKTTTRIAQEQGVSQATVSRRISDGLEQLRGALRRQGLLVAAGALGTMLMESTSQAVPPTVAAELSKMAMVGTTGAATLGGKAVLAAHAGTIKAVLAATAVVTAASVVGYIQYSRRPEIAIKTSAPGRIARSPASGNASSRSYVVNRAARTVEPQPESESPPVVIPSEPEQTPAPQSSLSLWELQPEREMGGGIMVGDPFSGLPTVDLTTPEAVVYSFLALIDQGATDQLSECFAEGCEAVADNPYPRYLGRPIRLVEVTEDGDTAQVQWEATAHTRFSHKGKDRFPGEFVALSSRLVRVGDAWKLLKLDE